MEEKKYSRKWSGKGKTTVNRDSLTVNRKWVHGYFWLMVNGEWFRVTVGSGQLMVNG